MLNVVVCFSFILGCELATPNCTFKPRTDLSCLKYLVSPTAEFGCLNPDEDLQFAGLRKEMNGEMYINVHSVELNVTRPIWVRKRDGICSEDCCDKRTKKGTYSATLLVLAFISYISILYY